MINPFSFRHRIAIVSLIAMVLGGCTSMDPQPAFQEVRQSVAKRTGHLVQWNSDGKEDHAVQARIGSMLENDLTLEEAIQIALLNNQRLQGIYERLGVAQANLVQAGLLRNPIFEADLKFLNNVSGTKAVLEMAVVQDFLEIFMIPLRKRLAKAELAMTQAEITAAIFDLTSDVKIAFISLQAVGHTLEMRKEILQSTEASYDVAQRLHRAGNLTDLALANERALYEQSKLAVATAQTNVLEARENMNVLLGLWGESIQWRINGVLPKTPEKEMDITRLEERAISSSLDLDLLRNQMRVVASRTGMEATELVFPELGSGAAAEYDPGQWSVGPALAIGVPIFDWGQARTAAGRRQLQRLWKEYTATAVEIRAAVRAAKYRLRNARRQCEYYRRVVVPLAEKITAESQLQYNAMQLGVFQLLQAKRNEISVQGQYILARRNYWVARTELEQILAGRLLRTTQVDLAAGTPMGNDNPNGH